MKKKFITRNKKKRRIKFLFFLCLFLFGIYLSFKILDKSSIKISDKTLAKFLVDIIFEKKIFSSDIFEKKIITPVSFHANLSKSLRVQTVYHVQLPNQYPALLFREIRTAADC